MTHPNNKMCADCFHRKRCSWLLDGELDGTETECDWEPSRFKENLITSPMELETFDINNEHKGKGDEFWK